MTTAQRPSDSRKRLLIHPKFQLLLLGVNLGVMLLFAAIVWATVQNTLLDLKPAAGLSGEEIDFYKRYLDYQAHSFQNAILISTVAGLMISGGVTLIVSHRIAGPMIRLRNFFRALATRSLSPLPKLEFREGDYFTDLPPLVNEAISRVHSGTATPGEAGIQEQGKLDPAPDSAQTDEAEREPA